MENDKNKKVYDLEERTYQFARRVDDYVNKLPNTTSYLEHGKQLVRSSGSIGANYIEANEKLGKKDFLMKIKTSKKESKESIYWLKLTMPDSKFDDEKSYLLNEAHELMNILGAILRNSQ
jgi:four helix bundle protein